MNDIEKIKKNFIICYVEFLLINFSKKYLLLLKIRGQKDVDKSVFVMLNEGIMILDKLVNAKNFNDKAKILESFSLPLEKSTVQCNLLLKDCHEYLKLVQELESIIKIIKSDLVQNKFFYRFYKYYSVKIKDNSNLEMNDLAAKVEHFLYLRL